MYQTLKELSIYSFAFAWHTILILPFLEHLAKFSLANHFLNTKFVETTIALLLIRSFKESFDRIFSEYLSILKSSILLLNILQLIRWFCFFFFIRYEEAGGIVTHSNILYRILETKYHFILLRTKSACFPHNKL